MKLKLKTKEFSNLLATVLPAVSMRSTLPTLSHFLIDAKEGKVSVYATDLEIGIESSISTDIEKEGSVTVPARNLTEMIKVLDSKEFTFQKVSDSQFKIFTSDGNTTFNIIGGEKEEFPVLPKIKKEKSVELKSCKIKEGIEKNQFRCADPKAAAEMAEVVEKMKQEGDSVGGIIEGIALNMPVGLGEPVFDTQE